MRLLLTVCFLFTLLSLGLTQGTATNLFTSVKPEATIRIRKHSMGADLVEITIGDSQYSPEALREQIRRLGTELHSEPRGLALSQVEFTKNDPAGAFLRANFAVDGLTDPAQGIYRIGPLARAMAGGPKGHEIHGLAIIFEGLAPTDTTLVEYGIRDGSPVSVLGRYEPGPIGLEYRVALNTQDPTQIVIPDRKSAAPPVTPASANSPSSTPWLLYAAVAFFALTIGALVYSLTPRNSGPRPPKALKNQPKGTSRHR